jgi:hypothetical protein
MAVLKKQVQLDPESGLYHEGAFRKLLIQILKDWSKITGGQKPEKLSLAKGEPPPTLILGFLSLQSKVNKTGSFSIPLETDSRTWLKEITSAFPTGTVLATIQHHPLIIGFVIASPEEGSHPPFQAFQRSSELDRKLVYRVGWASLDPRDKQTFQENFSKYSLMTYWWERAWTALEFTQYLGENRVLAYDEILDKAGRVIDLLPSHRIVINLGKKPESVSYAFFILEKGDADEERMAVLLEIQEDFIVEVIYLWESGRPPSKNDWVCWFGLW